MNNMSVFSDTVNNSFNFAEVFIEGDSFLIDTTSKSSVAKLERILKDYPDSLEGTLCSILSQGGLDYLRKFSSDTINRFCLHTDGKVLRELEYDIFEENSAEHNLCLYPRGQYCPSTDSEDVLFLQYIGDSSKPQQPLNCSNTYLMFSDFAGESLDLSHWDVSDIQDMCYMFCACTFLSDLNLSSWDTRKLSLASSMFYGCVRLCELDVNSWSSVDRLKDASYMFAMCERLKKLDLSRWSLRNDCSNEYMFYSCDTLATTNNEGIDKILEETRFDKELGGK